MLALREPSMSKSECKLPSPTDDDTSDHDMEEPVPEFDPRQMTRAEWAISMIEQGFISMTSDADFAATPLPDHWRAKKSLKLTVKLFSLTPIADGTKVVLRTEPASVDMPATQLPEGIRCPVAIFHNCVAEFGDLRFLSSSGRASYFPVYYCIYHAGGYITNAQAADPIKITVDGPRQRRDRMPTHKRGSAERKGAYPPCKREMKYSKPAFLHVPHNVKGGMACRSCRSPRCQCGRCNTHCRCSPHSAQTLATLYTSPRAAVHDGTRESSGSLGSCPASPSGSELSNNTTLSPIAFDITGRNEFAYPATTVPFPLLNVRQPVGPALLMAATPQSGVAGDVCHVYFTFAALPPASSVAFGLIFGTHTPDFLGPIQVTPTSAQLSFIIPPRLDATVTVPMVGLCQINDGVPLQAVNHLSFQYLT